MSEKKEQEKNSARLISLDVFRGITIAGMVLVNNPGSWSAIYPPLKHADWHGWTPTDFIFPFFLLIVGVAIPLALGKRVEEGGGISRDVYLKILRRAALIFLLGLILSGFPFFDLTTLRIPGVLQRIAVCYLVVSLLFLHLDWKKLAVFGVVCLFLYWALMTVVPVPGCDFPNYDDKACNLAAWVDRSVFGENHIWRSAKVYDPEGILSTIPALATTIAGVLTGLWLKTKRPDFEKVGGLFFAGVSAVAVGYVWHYFFPINKPLWTSSYVVFTAGMALCTLAFCYWLVDIKGYRKWAQPFVIFGVNALALFVFSGLLARLLGVIKVTNANGKSVSLQSYIFESVFLPLASPVNASLLYAISYILLWLFLMWILYRNKIFIKV